jgi:hypothetical protein
MKKPYDKPRRATKTTAVRVYFCRKDYDSINFAGSSGNTILFTRELYDSMVDELIQRLIK